MIMIRLGEDKEKRDWEPVDKLLDSIEHQRSLSPNLAVLKAEVLLAKDRSREDKAENRPAEAKDPPKDYLQMPVKFPKSVQIWQALINLAMYRAEKESDAGQKEKKWKQVSDYIDRAGAVPGRSPQLAGEAGQLRRPPQGSPSECGIEEAGREPRQDDDAEKEHLWGSLYALSVQINDLDLARAYCRLLVANDEKNIQVRHLLCDLNLRVYEKDQTPDLRGA